MNTLFDITPQLPEGFQYSPNFITEAEEKLLLETIGKYELQTMKFHQYEAKRKVMNFGRGWSFTEQQLKQGAPIPAEFDFLIGKIATKLAIPTSTFTQLLITEYPVDSVINWHRDAPPFNIIAGVSLLSDCIFKLRPQDEKLRQKAIQLPVQKRSLYSMQGPAKTAWQHATAPVKQKRYSLTFRTVL